MAAEYNIQKLVDTNRRAVIKFTCNFTSANSADLTNLVFIRANTLSGAFANLTYYDLAVKEIFYSVKSAGNGRISLSWAGANTTNNIPMLTLAGGAHVEFTGNFSPLVNNAPNPNGDILLQFKNMVEGDSATVIIDVRKNVQYYDAGQTADPDAFKA